MPSAIFGFSTQEIHEFCLICGAIIGVGGLAICVNWFDSRKAALICCVIGSVFIAGAILTSGRRWFNDTAVGLYGFLIILNSFGLYLYFKSKKTTEDITQNLINKLSRSDILYPIGIEFTEGHCWCCGEKTTDIQHVRLLRIIFLFVVVGAEELTLPVPVCKSHGNLSQGLINFSKKHFKLKHLNAEANVAVISFADEDVAQLVKNELGGQEPV